LIHCFSQLVNLVVSESIIQFFDECTVDPNYMLFRTETVRDL